MGSQHRINHDSVIKQLGCVLIIAFIASTGLAQDRALERQIAAIAETEARNRTALADYTWKQEEIILVNDKFRAHQMFQAELGSDGTIQRIAMDLPEERVPGEETGRGIRGWLDQKKERTLQRYAEEIRELSEIYTQTTPDLLRQAYAKGEVSYENAGQSGRLLIRSYVKSGDSVIVMFDPKNNELKSLEVSSYLDDSHEPVQISAGFAGTGDEINRVDQITAIDQKRKLQVSIHNFDYQPRLTR